MSTSETEMQIEQQLQALKSWMQAHNYAPRTCGEYLRILRLAHTNPVRYMRDCTSLGVFRHARGAFKALSLYTGNEEIFDSIRKISPPKAGPKRVREIPDAAEWVAVARRIWAVPGPLGAAVWVLVWSSLRVSDTVRLSQLNISELAAKGSTICFQKGKGGVARRRFVAGPLSVLGIKRLASEKGYESLWQLLAPSQESACAKIRKTLAPWGCHDFRRCFISFAVRSKMPIPMIQACSGHSSLEALSKYIIANVALPDDDVYAAQDNLMKFVLELAKKQTKEP